MSCDDRDGRKFMVLASVVWSGGETVAIKTYWGGAFTAEERCFTNEINAQHYTVVNEMLIK
jgi:hypothetical protein